MIWSTTVQNTFASSSVNVVDIILSLYIHCKHKKMSAFQVAPNIDEVIWKCYWGGNVTSCSEIFTSVLTDAGLCYTFNILSAKEMFNSGT